MSRRAALGGCLAVALVAAPAHGATGRCVTVVDARGDVNTVLMPLEPERADLLEVRVVASPRDVTATFVLAGPPRAPLYENLQYTVDFTDGETTYQLAVDKKRSEEFVYQLRIRTGGVEASNTGTDSWRSEPVAGAVDAARHTVTVHSDGRFGRIPAGRRWKVTAVEAWQGYGTGYGVVDRASAPNAHLVAGDGRCRR